MAKVKQGIYRHHEGILEKLNTFCLYRCHVIRSTTTNVHFTFYNVHTSYVFELVSVLGSPWFYQGMSGYYLTNFVK